MVKSECCCGRLQYCLSMPLGLVFKEAVFTGVHAAGLLAFLRFTISGAIHCPSMRSLDCTARYTNACNSPEISCIGHECPVMWLYTHVIRSDMMFHQSLWEEGEKCGGRLQYCLSMPLEVVLMCSMPKLAKRCQVRHGRLYKVPQPPDHQSRHWLRSDSVCNTT